jgi:hypothetical protein
MTRHNALSIQQDSYLEKTSYTFSESHQRPLQSFLQEALLSQLGRDCLPVPNTVAGSSKETYREQQCGIS